jgi:hypothetical protein
MVMAAALVAVSCGMPGCGGSNDGSRIEESKEVAERRQKGIREAMKSGAYGPQGKKAFQKPK